MIRLTGVTVRYGRRTVLDEANFHLPEGGIAYVTGRSGRARAP